MASLTSGSGAGLDPAFAYDDSHDAAFSSAAVADADPVELHHGGRRQDRAALERRGGGRYSAL
jgi:hypothetical protein